MADRVPSIKLLEGGTYSFSGFISLFDDFEKIYQLSQGSTLKITLDSTIDARLWTPQSSGSAITISSSDGIEIYNLNVFLVEKESYTIPVGTRYDLALSGGIRARIRNSANNTSSEYQCHSLTMSVNRQQPFTQLIRLFQ